MILFAIAYLITGALAQTGTKIALDNVDSVNAPTALRLLTIKSGLLAVSSIEEGLFLVKRSDPKSRRLRGARV